MPNWVLNKVKFYGNKDRLTELKNFVKTENYEFDFDKIMPTPPDLLKVSSGGDELISVSCATAKALMKKTCHEYEFYAWAKEKTFDEWAEIGQKYLKNLVSYGFTTWYNWRLAKWGTKWNSCDAIWNEDDSVTFNTAWSMPNGIFVKLAELFPDITIEVEFADEDIGSNCGQACYNKDISGNNTVNWINTEEFSCYVLNIDFEEWKKEQSSNENLD